jgi:cell division protein FtsW
VIANAARHEPEAVATLRAGRDDRMNRLLRLPLPEPYAPTKVEALRDRLRSRPQAAKPAVKSQRTSVPKATAKRPTKTPTADRSARRSGHHGGGQRNAGQRHARGGRALEGQRYG